jgi:hypothetical protein
VIKVFLLNSVVVAVAVIIHYEILFRMSLYLPKMQIRHRFRIVVGVFGAIIAHTLEIWMFALAYHFMYWADGWGHLRVIFQVVSGTVRIFLLRPLRHWDSATLCLLVT